MNFRLLFSTLVRISTLASDGPIGASLKWSTLSRFIRNVRFQFTHCMEGFLLLLQGSPSLPLHQGESSLHFHRVSHLPFAQLSPKDICTALLTCTDQRWRFALESGASFRMDNSFLDPPPSGSKCPASGSCSLYAHQSNLLSCLWSIILKISKTVDVFIVCSRQEETVGLVQVRDWASRSTIIFVGEDLHLVLEVMLGRSWTNGSKKVRICSLFFVHVCNW